MPDVATVTPERHYATTNGGPPPGPFQAIIRHPVLALLPVLVLVGAAVVIGHVRKPVYTSEARLGVGTLSPSSQSNQASADATTQLASTYSRAINAQAVIRDVSRKTDIPPSTVRSNLSASALADSPLVKVQATAESRRDAVVLARAGSDALIRYVSTVAGSGTNGQQLLRRFKAAQEKAAAAQEVAGISIGVAKRRAEAEFEAASLKAKALKLAYVQQNQGAGGETPLRVLVSAEGASSDQTKKLRLYLVIGALTGILAGVALATARAARRQS
jgi:capsular polysaccharide biosynthesis protein